METEVVSELLLDVTKIKTIKIEPKWFTDRNLAYIVADVVEQDGDDHDFIMMAERIKEKHPDSIVTKDLLIDLATNSIVNTHLAKHARNLEIKYHENRLANYSQHYAEQPTVKNYKKMKDAMLLLDDVRDAEQDNGDLSVAIEELYEEIENGIASGVHTFGSIDAVLGDGMSGGMLVTIAARPAVGKTTFGVNLVLQALRNETKGIRADFFGLEMMKKEMLKKFVSSITGIDSYKFVNTKLQLNRDEKNHVVASATWLNDSGLSIIDNQFDIDDIERTIRRRRFSEDGKYIAFIDYLQLVNVKGIEQRYLQIGEVTRRLKKLANELDIPIVIFSQVSRGVEARQDKTPTLADLRESGDIEQDSSVVAFLSNDQDDDGLVRFTVAKNRNGRTTMIPFRFLKSKSTFVEELQ